MAGDGVRRADRAELTGFLNVECMDYLSQQMLSVPQQQWTDGNILLLKSFALNLKQTPSVNVGNLPH